MSHMYIKHLKVSFMYSVYTCRGQHPELLSISLGKPRYHGADPCTHVTKIKIQQLTQNDINLFSAPNINKS